MRKNLIWASTSIFIGIILFQFIRCFSLIFFLLAVLIVINEMTSRRIVATKKGPFSLKNRNYQLMVIGGAATFKALTNITSTSYFNLSAPAHTVFGMALAVKRYYSFTAENAVINMIIDLNSEISDKLNIYDIVCLHRVTLAELGGGK